MIIGGLVMHPFPRATEALRLFAEFMRTAPDELVAAAVLLTGPDGNKACGIAAAYSGDLAQGAQVVAPLKQFGPPVLDVIGPMPYLSHLWTDRAQNEPNIAGVRETWAAIQPVAAGGVYVNELGEDDGAGSGPHGVRIELRPTAADKSEIRSR